MTEIAVGYGNYFGKLWGTFFVGEPTRDYKRLFNLAVSVHDRAIENLKPGHCVTVIAFPVTTDMKKGLWVGTTCLSTKKGLKKLHAYPVNRLRVVEV